MERRKGEALKVTQRPIQHPLYKNISMADAAAALTAANVAVRAQAGCDLACELRGVVASGDEAAGTCPSRAAGAWQGQSSLFIPAPRCHVVLPPPLVLLAPRPPLTVP